MTEEDVRREVLRALKARVLEDEQLAKAAEQQGKEYRRKYVLESFQRAEYETWTQSRLAGLRKMGLLVSAQQLADIKNKRVLAEGDRVRYIGPTELQMCRDGQNYLRKTGEIGRIVKAVKGSGGQLIYTFLPDFPKEALEETGPTVRIAQLTFQQDTPGYFLLERMPEKDEQPATAPRMA